MTNDLRVRLDALNGKATPGEWSRKGPSVLGDFALVVGDNIHGETYADIRYGTEQARKESSANSRFITNLVNAYRSGDLVTRQEMEEAVAKAVEDEREACATLCDATAQSRQQQIDVGNYGAEQNERWRCGKQQSQFLANKIRARSSNKEPDQC